MSLFRRLESYGQLQGLVLGAFQEGNQDIHSLLETLADSQLRVKGLERGREDSSQEKPAILAGMRRQLSIAAARAYSACLLDRDRASRVGEGHRQSD